MGLVTLFIGARRPYVPKPTKMRAVVIESYTSIQLEPGKEVDGGREGAGGGSRHTVPPRIIQKALPNETVESESIEQEPHWDGSLMPHRVGLALGGYVEKETFRLERGNVTWREARCEDDEGVDIESISQWRCIRIQRTSGNGLALAVHPTRRSIMTLHPKPINRCSSRQSGFL